MMPVVSFVDVPDRDLVAEVKRLAASERHATAALVASLAEMDGRRLYLAEGCCSLFTYCTQVLHLSEHAAYGRIEAARAGRRFPAILELLAEGAITLTTVGLLARHLTPDNHRAVLDAARHKGKRDVEHMVAALHPQPDLPSTIRKLPAARATANPPVAFDPSPSAPADRADTPGREGEPVRSATPPVPPAVTSTGVARNLAPPRPVAAVPAPPPPAVVTPIAPERYKVQITVGRETHEKLRRAQDLLRHAVPSGDLAEIFDRALTLLVAHLERTKAASTKRPRPQPARPPRGRTIPAAVRRAVWGRDGGQCAFVGTEGRCTERGFLEYHHVVPYADGGAPTIENVEIRCRRHNQHEAETWFGPLVARERPEISRFRRDSVRTDISALELG